MHQCEQTKGQSIFQHGQQVQSYSLAIIHYLRTGKKRFHLILPSWIDTYRTQILSALQSNKTISTYTLFHDCGKPFCRTQDQDGKIHFTDHAKVSSDTWKNTMPDQYDVADLMYHDMDIHLAKASDIDELCKNKNIVTHLIVGLAEVLANAQLFGGYDSTSFKIKFKRIDQRGKQICSKLFNK